MVKEGTTDNMYNYPIQNVIGKFDPMLGSIFYIKS